MSISPEAGRDQSFFADLLARMKPHEQVLLFSQWPSVGVDYHVYEALLMAVVPALKTSDDDLRVMLDTIVSRVAKSFDVLEGFRDQWIELLFWVIEHRLNIFVCAGAYEQGFVSKILENQLDTVRALNLIVWKGYLSPY